MSDQSEQKPSMPYNDAQKPICSTSARTQTKMDDQQTLSVPSKKKKLHLGAKYRPNNDATLLLGDRLDLLGQIPDGAAQLVVTSPPYNIGKEYEKVRTIKDYLADQEDTLKESVRILADNGSLCWQVGNHISKGEVLPLDVPIYNICKSLGLKMRNRIIWHFEHGLHCSKRFSGRYETIIWFTKTDDYIFDLDPVRVPQKYPGKKNYKGNKAGEFSCNPKGKNPGDLWIIPNVKHNHKEKSGHPCQFPIELIERLVLSMTEEKGLVVDPYAGVASALCAAVRRNRRAAGADMVEDYVSIGKERIKQAWNGTLPVRPLGKPVYEPKANSKLTKAPSHFAHSNGDSNGLF